MSEHTQGPWWIAKSDRDEHLQVFPHTGLLVANLRKPLASDAEDHAEVEANARLIAAAPDLLGVLQKVQFALGNYESTTILSEYGDQINAAIAKAVSK